MNNKSAVLAFCAIEVNDSTISLELINSGIDELADYEVSNESLIARISCNALSSLLTISSLKEGDLTIGYSLEGINQRLKFLANKYGFNDILEKLEPKITSPKPW